MGWNQCNDSIFSSLTGFSSLKSLYLSGNGLIGSINSFQLLPMGLGKLENLYLSFNQLNSSILSILSGLSSLKSLDLSYNMWTGSGTFFNSSTLEDLHLDHTSLPINFLQNIGALPALKVLSIGECDLYGTLPAQGMLPRWFVNSTQLGAIDLSKNHFKGPIPGDFCKLDWLEYLDLSENNLSGHMPSCFNPPQITHIHLSGNRLSSPLTYGFYNCSSLVTMDLRDNSFIDSIPTLIGNLSSLSVLLLRANHFNGELPIQLCLLEQLSILDVSQNQLSGPLPSCLGNFTLKESSQKAFVNFIFGLRSPMESAYYEIMGPPLVDIMYILEKEIWLNFTEVIEFRTKNMYYGYMGKILSYMSGIDLSNNNLVGAIPPEFGNLSEILSLNLSHNNLIGCIPATFSNLKQIESLDLSYNNLNGAIPPQLTEITTLEVFSVVHNNLSGKTPERKFQFGTFDESCYEGNPFLCGLPLRNNCSEESVSSQPVPDDEQGDDGFIDMEFFYISFGVCYTVVVMTITTILYINPYWRRRWLYFIEDCIDTCYYFLVASFRKFSSFRR